MRKKFSSAILVSLFAFGADLRVLCSLGPASAYKQSSDQRPSPDAMQLVARINAAVKPICGTNCPSVMVFRNATAPNAMLTVVSAEGKLVYAPQFLAAVHDGFGDAGIIAIIAHEFGHALDDALGAKWIQNSWTPELRADSWAGCALAKSNLNAAEMQSALGALAKYPSPAHPAWNVRLPALRAGYSGCGGTPAKFNSK